jgi:hypothetical protein
MSEQHEAGFTHKRRIEGASILCDLSGRGRTYTKGQASWAGDSDGGLRYLTVEDTSERYETWRTTRRAERAEWATRKESSPWKTRVGDTRYLSGQVFTREDTRERESVWIRSAGLTPNRPTDNNLAGIRVLVESGARE